MKKNIKDHLLSAFAGIALAGGFIGAGAFFAMGVATGGAGFFIGGAVVLATGVLSSLAAPGVDNGLKIGTAAVCGLATLVIAPSYIPTPKPTTAPIEKTFNAAAQGDQKTMKLTAKDFSLKPAMD
jgi:hypothetical protein